MLPCPSRKGQTMWEILSHSDQINAGNPFRPNAKNNTGCIKKGEPTPGGADSPKRREEGQNGMSDESSKSSVDADAPPAGMAPPLAGSVAGCAAVAAPFPFAPFGLSRNWTL